VHVGRRVRARDALAGVRVLHHANAVPHHHSAIDFVEEDTVASAAVTVDGRGTPAVAARRRDPFAVERCGDRADRERRYIVAEDATHDVRLGRFDRQLAGLTRHRPIAVGAAASMAAFTHHAGHPATHLVAYVAQGDRAGDAAHPDAQFI